MYVKFVSQVGGGHVHFAVFMGKDKDHLGKAGDLCLRIEEYMWLYQKISGPEIEFAGIDRVFAEDMAQHPDKYKFFQGGKDDDDSPVPQ
jgi:hypothetical protein